MTCHAVIPDTFVACGEGGNFCSSECLYGALAEKHGVRLVRVGRDEIVVEGDEDAKKEFFLDVAAMLET